MVLWDPNTSVQSVVKKQQCNLTQCQNGQLMECYAGIVIQKKLVIFILATMHRLAKNNFILLLNTC